MYVWWTGCYGTGRIPKFTRVSSISVSALTNIGQATGLKNATGKSAAEGFYGRLSGSCVDQN